MLFCWRRKWNKAGLMMILIEIPQCWQQLPASVPWLHWATALMVFFNFFLTDRHTVLRCPSFCRKHVHVCTCYVPSTGYTNHIALVDCVNQRLCRGADLSEIFLFLSVSRIVIGSETSHYPNTTWSTRSSTTYVHPMQVVESTNSEQTPMMFGQHFLAFPFCSPIR